MTYDEWNFEHGGADPHKQLLGITLWTLTPRDKETRTFQLVVVTWKLRGEVEAKNCQKKHRGR